MGLNTLKMGLNTSTFGRGVETPNWVVRQILGVLRPNLHMMRPQKMLRPISILNRASWASFLSLRVVVLGRSLLVKLSVSFL